MLCVSLMPASTEAARAGLAKAARLADLAEIRLDAMAECDLERVLRDRPCPVIVTHRPVREGGRYDGPEAPRLAALRRAADLGAEYVDVEHDAIGELGPVAARVIVSRHDTEGTPGDLRAVYDGLCRLGADVVKVAVTATHILDAAAVLELLRDARQPTIALAMGERGLLTRVLAPKFGAVLTFASLGDEAEAAPGQVSAARMRDLYRIDRLGPATRVFGVMADPVGHSLSPAIHNAAFAETGLDAVYLPLWVEGDPTAFVRAMRPFGVDGYSVTIPHKQTVMPVLDEIEPIARRIGAVNTVHRLPDGRLVGSNTDWSAGIASLEAALGEEGLEGKQAVQLGAGGVGRAMAFGLRQRGANVVLADVDPTRAEALAEEIDAEAAPLEALPYEEADLVLNCTPVGMHPNEDATPVRADRLREGQVVYDAVYNPLETRLTREARDAGCRTVPGIDHFVRQAVEQFELWTGETAPVETMRQVVVNALSG